MSRSLKMAKGSVVTMALILVGFLIIENVIFERDKGNVTSGDMELWWEVPSENVDNRPQSTLAGYKIRCWNSVEQMMETIVIEDPKVTTYEIDHLPPGTYQCAMSAVDLSGSQSALSNVVVRTVP